MKQRIYLQCTWYTLYLWEIVKVPFSWSNGSMQSVPITTNVVSSNPTQATCRLFSSGTPASSTNKTDRHDITEIFLIVALNTINPKPEKHISVRHCIYNIKYSWCTVSILVITSNIDLPFIIRFCVLWSYLLR